VLGRCLLTALALAALIGCGRQGDVAGDSGGAVRFEVVSQGPEAETAKTWAPIVADLQTSARLNIEPSYASEASAAVSALRSRTTEVAWLSDGAALEAARVAESEVFARTRPAAGSAPDHALLISSAKGRIALPRVLTCDRRLSIGLGEPLATATLAAEAYLFAPKALAPAKCFRRVRRGPGLSNLDELAAGRLDLVVIDTAWLSAARRQGKGAGLVELWRSPPLPEKPLVWRKDLDPAIKEKLRQFFLTYGQNDAQQRNRLAVAGISGFVAADDDDLLPAREMEAAHLWLEAVARGDKTKIAETRRAYDAVTAERQDLEARTRTPASAQ
jgi:phosphonate transport system substrate-binding protein